MKILFWNINNKSLNKEFDILALNVNPDIIIIAECSMRISEILSSLNNHQVKYFYNADPICSKILMFSKFHDEYVSPITSSLRYTVRSIKVPTYPEFNLMCLHFQSKVHWDFSDQAAHSFELNSVINQFEEKSENNKTIVLGDFNMNPFDFGMVQTTGLHAVMTKEVALNKSRTVDGKEYPFFYNPMWSFYGDYGKGKASGTIYNTLSKPVNYFWNIFDQVLIRPDLLEFLDEENLEIITQLDEETMLLKKTNRIDERISDHLPISVTLKNL